MMKLFGKFKLKPTESLLISLVTVALMALFQFYWVAPGSKRLTELRTSVATTQKKVDETKKMIAGFTNRSPAAVVAEESKTEKSLLDRYISSNIHFSNLISGIFTHSKGKGFDVERMVTEKSSKFEGYTQTLYRLDAESSFIEIGRFLESLEDSALLTEVESIDISRIENEVKRCKASIRLYGYVGGSSK